MATKHGIQQANQAIQAGKFDEAAHILRGVVASQPGNFKNRWLLMRSLEQLKQFDEVHEQLWQLLNIASRDLPKINQVAEYVRARRYSLGPVIEAYRKYLEHNPRSALAAYNYAYHLGAARQRASAMEAYQRALDLGIEGQEEVYLNMANLCMDDFHGNQKAKEHLNTALSINPNYVQAHFNLGNLAERMGDRDEAQARFEKCLELDPKNEFALARLADASVFSDRDQPLLGRLEQSAAESKNPDIHYALGRAYDKLEDYDAAWREFTRANELDRATHPEYRQSHSEALVRRIIDRCDAEWLSKFGGTSHEAIFVCGMFRSGSTLLEQILAAHPGFAAGGESEFFPRLVMKNFRGYPDGIEVIDPVSIEVWREEHAALCAQLTEGDERMTDKRPDNFLYAGLIKAIVPGAKFVVTERDWRDVVVSVFCNRLGPGQAYATRPQDIKHYLGLHRELIDHWAGLLGEDVIRVSYEDLVESPTATIGTLLEQLGEEWDDACLEFDTREGSVGTASVWQVREPINPKSIGRWKNYEKYFEQEFGAAT